MKKRFSLLVVLALFFPAACLQPRVPRVALPEAEEAAMTSCRYIDTFNEYVPPNAVILFWAARECVDRVQTRAVSRGATHLVWLYRNNVGASARAFRCP